MLGLKNVTRNCAHALFAVSILAGTATRAQAAGTPSAPSPASDLLCAPWQVADGTAEGHSMHLGCTGLYRDFASRAISEGVEEYAPGYVLWSDGADKRRWIYLPPGTQIDTGGPAGVGDMDGWVFPVGTKLWKEFAFGGRRIETRYLWKRASGWFGATYVWSLDGLTALEYTGPVGIPSVGDGPGEPYEIPPPSACVNCHAGSKDHVLGFDAVNLAAERATGLTLDELVRRGLLSTPPIERPIAPGNADAREALGWLHANCGTSCHNERGVARGTGLRLRLATGQLGSVAETATWQTAVGIGSGYQPPAGGADCDPELGCARIEPGHPDRSTVVFRAAVRDPYPGPYSNQMPPIGSHRVPADAAAALARWITGLGGE